MSNGNYFDSILHSLTGTPTVPESVTRRSANSDHLASRVDGGYDPEYIALFENFHGMEHPEIFQLAQSISPVAMSTLATEWAKLGTGFSHTVGWGTLRIRSLIAERWEGDAALAAADAVVRFGESAGRMSSAARAVSEKLQVAAEIGEQVKSSVPPPPLTAPLPLAAFSPSSAADAARQAEAVRARAIQVMEALYKPYYRDSGSSVPVLPPPYDSTDGSTLDSFRPAGGAPGASPGTGSAPGVSAGSGHSPTAVDDTSVSEEQTATSDPSGDGSTDGTGQGAGSEDLRGEPAGTQPTATSPAAAGTLGGPAGQSYGSPGREFVSPGPMSSSAGGSGPYGGGAGGSSTFGPAPLAAGHPSATTPAAATPAGATARGGTAMRPMGMMPGMMTPGTSRSDEQDKRVAGYLVTNEHGSELIGALPDTAPPVLGADPL